MTARTTAAPNDVERRRISARRAGGAGPTHSAGAHNSRHDSAFRMGTNMSEKPTIIYDLADYD